jgi:hypothetical protein
VYVRVDEGRRNPEAGAVDHSSVRRSRARLAVADALETAVSHKDDGALERTLRGAVDEGRSDDRDWFGRRSAVAGKPEE